MLRLTLPILNESEWLDWRTTDLTSTDTAALLGCHPRGKTRFELWHEKHSGVREPFPDNKRMEAGRRFEHAIGHWIAAENNWTIEPLKDYMRLAGLRIGASFDFVMRGLREDYADDTLLEIKNVDWLEFRKRWSVDDGGFIEAPPHIEIQVQHQMLVRGCRRAYIGVLVGGNAPYAIYREADHAVQELILREARAFWSSADAGEAPPYVMPDDADALIRLNQVAAKGHTLDARADELVQRMVRDYHSLTVDRDKIEDQRKVLKAEFFQAIGYADRVLVPGFSVATGSVKASSGTLVTPDMVGTFIGARNGSRQLRITKKEE